MLAQLLHCIECLVLSLEEVTVSDEHLLFLRQLDLGWNPTSTTRYL